MRLESIRERLDGLLVKRGRPGPFTRSWGLEREPVEVQSEQLALLLKRIAPKQSSGSAPPQSAEIRPFLDAACRELELNVERVAQLAGSRDRPPLAYITWLWKVSEALLRVAADQSVADARHASPDALLPPLPPAPGLAGFAVDPLLELASRETQVLGRRRRLFEAARRALLETAASTPLPEAAVQARLACITRHIREINQWQNEGVAPDVTFAHQLRSAVQRRDQVAVTHLFGVLQELTSGARSTAQQRAHVASACTAVRLHFSAAKAPELARLCADTFGSTAAQAVQRGSERARRELESLPHAEAELVQAGSCVDGCFELGRSVAPVRVVETQRRMAEVTFPTQSMVLRNARGPNDVPTSLVGDPRLVLYELASHSLLARRFLAQRVTRAARTPRYSEARYYLIDGSASMSGRRGRVRDAILIAELGTMIRHLESGEAAARPVVYFRYFSKTLEPLVRASTIDEAQACIESILVRKSRGETEIESALVASFAEIARERERDSTLARAQIVLVTDGIAVVDPQRVWQARQQLGSMPVQLSVIALGHENTALKALAAWQRARGESVFYHFVSDETMYSMIGEVRVTRPPLTAKPRPEPSLISNQVSRRDPPSAEAAVAPPAHVAADAELWLTLEQLVDELCVLHEPPDLDELERAPFLRGAFEELELSLEGSQLEAERARYEAQVRAARSLGLRFDRWFPDPKTLRRDAAPPPSSELLGVIEIVLSTTVELVPFLGGSPLARRVDAIEILERLLLEAGVSPWAYCRALPFAEHATRGALERLRSAAP